MRTSVLALFAALNRPALGAVPRDSVPMEAVTLVNCVERTGLAFSVMAYYAPPDGIFSGSPPAAKDVCRVNVPAFQVWENTTSTCTFKPSGVKFKATLGPFLRDGDDNATGRGANDYHDNFQCWYEKKIGGCPGFTLGTASCSCIYSCMRWIYD